MNDMLTWHVYEMLFGILTAGVMAFLTTGLPELFPGTVPFIGKRLKYIMILWILGRLSFWFIDITGVYLAAILNLDAYKKEQKYSTIQTMNCIVSNYLLCLYFSSLEIDDNKKKTYSNEEVF